VIDDILSRIFKLRPYFRIVAVLANGGYAKALCLFISEDGPASRHDKQAWTASARVSIEQSPIGRHNNCLGLTRFIDETIPADIRILRAIIPEDVCIPNG
jgi:hypothetical protein